MFSVCASVCLCVCVSVTLDLENGLTDFLEIWYICCRYGETALVQISRKSDLPIFGNLAPKLPKKYFQIAITSLFIDRF
jgi:hypothetical protein